MDFRGENPGAVQYGNFKNYYSFNSAKDRLHILPTHVWCGVASEEANENTKPYIVLDVGCNSGDLTQLLWHFLQQQMEQRSVHILGIDIDAALIERAVQTNIHSEHVSYATVDIMNKEDCALIENYLQNQGRTQFDAVCCFSITMWIHLNHSEVGLLEFLSRLSNQAELLVVEPQPWKCYQTAARRLRKSSGGEEFPYFSELKWRSSVDSMIQRYLEQLGRRKIFECLPTKWKRHICFYR